MPVLSPLTLSNNVALIEEVSSADLLRLYKRLGFTELKELQPNEKIGLYLCKASDLRFFFPQAAGEAE